MREIMHARLCDVFKTTNGCDNGEIIDDNGYSYLERCSLEFK